LPSALQGGATSGKVGIEFVRSPSSYVTSTGRCDVSRRNPNRPKKAQLCQEGKQRQRQKHVQQSGYVQCVEPSTPVTDDLSQRRLPKSEYTHYADSGALMQALNLACRDGHIDLALSCPIEENNTLDAKAQVFLFRQSIEVTTGWRFV
jgi:hypothetical protein